MVFADRIVDAEGKEICRSGGLAPQPSETSRPAEIRDVLQVLPQQEQRVFLSYWWMVEAGGPCQPGDKLKTIHQTLLDLLDVPAQERNDQLAEPVQDLFVTNRFPEFDTWRRTLDRIKKRYKQEPEILALLHRIGIGRRSPRGGSS